MHNYSHFNVIRSVLLYRKFTSLFQNLYLSFVLRFIFSLPFQINHILVKLNWLQICIPGIFNDYFHLVIDFFVIRIQRQIKLRQYIYIYIIQIFFRWYGPCCCFRCTFVFLLAFPSIKIWLVYLNIVYVRTTGTNCIKFRCFKVNLERIINILIMRKKQPIIQILIIRKKNHSKGTL